ncbi:hypothetical protein V074_02574 [Staphylococcus aureus 2010-60-1240-1]|uniref:hypothetical protein n=1 Tax=Staphylococcus aureus TaxID=1280 RepID=UPI000449EB59|nr:hypothetical protein [Staphylococcus aureus]EZV57619.1 hypothetical protein V074_02574 [Staphylococcus aureus 2010-60-1240-1]HDE6300861.1 hypothetical protein [Staphylococcus aureus]HDG4682637.1 hypothetical protein [Staphylococcus aureus]
MVNNSSKKSKLTKKRIANRKRLGWKPSDLNKPPRVYRKLSNSQLETLKNNGISKNRYYERLSNGWSEKDAMTVPTRKYTKITPQEEKWMEESGVDSTTFRTRVSRNMDRETAAKKPKK